jgi:hypothetical protein
VPPPVLVIVTVPEAVYTQFEGFKVSVWVLSCIDGGDGGCVIVIVTAILAGLPETTFPVSGSTALIVTVAV